MSDALQDYLNDRSRDNIWKIDVDDFSVKLVNLMRLSKGKKELDLVFVYEKGDIYYDGIFKNKIIYTSAFINKYGRINQQLSDINHKLVVVCDKSKLKEHYIFDEKVINLEVKNTRESIEEFSNLVNNKLKFNNEVTREIYGNYLEFITPLAHSFCRMRGSDFLNKEDIHKAYDIIKECIKRFNKMFNAYEDESSKTMNCMERFRSFLLKGISEKSLKHNLARNIRYSTVSKLLLALRNLDLITYYIDKDTSQTIVKGNDRLRSANLELLFKKIRD